MAKTKYDTHIKLHLAEIAEWVRAGATEPECAKKLGIGISTFQRYLAKGRDGDENYKEFADTVDAARMDSDDRVEASLFMSATGYDAPVTKHYKLRRVEYDPETGRKIAEREELKEVVEKVHIPANVSAQQFWLANRRPEKWQYKPTPGDREEPEPELTMEDKFAALDEAAASFASCAGGGDGE